MFDMYLIEHFVWAMWTTWKLVFLSLLLYMIYGDKHLMVSIYVYINNNINDVLIMIGLVI